MKTPKEKQEGELTDVLDISLEEVDSSYIPEGFDSVDAFLEDMRNEYEADILYDKQNREEILEDKKFAAGEQWDPQVLQDRAGLPCLTINNIPQFTSQLVGDWREARKGIKVLPANDEDRDIAEIRSDIIRGIENESRAHRVYANAFESTVECGDGAFRVTVEYAKDDVFDQDIRLKTIEDCLSVVWDRYSVDPTGRDARRCFVDERVPKNEFKRKWPEHKTDALSFGTEFLDTLSTQGWIDENTYKVTEYWRIVDRKKLIGLFQNGEIFEINEGNQDKLIDTYGPPVKTRISWCSYAQMHLCTGHAILAGPYEYKLNRLPIIRITGRVTNVGNRRIRYGLVRLMKDLIRMKNFWRSTSAEQLGYAPKAKWIGPASAFEGREEAFRKAHLTRDPVLIYNDDAEAQPELINPPAIETALLAEASQNSQDMKDVTGIHDASLGIKSNEVSGRAINARQREGDIASLTFYDNADSSVLEAGDVINQLLPQVYDGTRIARRIGEDGKVKFTKLNDPYDPDSIDMSVGKFDVVMSTGLSFQTKRVEAAYQMRDTIQVAPELMEIAGDHIVAAQDWPGADKIAARIKKTIPPHLLEEDEEGGGLGITAEELQEMKMQMQQIIEENKALKADKSVEERKLLIDGYNAETQRIRALSDNMVDAEGMNLKYIETIVNGSKSIDELDLKREELSTRAATQQSGASSSSDKSS